MTGKACLLQAPASHRGTYLAPTYLFALHLYFSCGCQGLVAFLQISVAQKTVFDAVIPEVPEVPAWC